ncbi:hypothetical protein LUZ60_008516 [Juncus effusus]|nr:hypothetical protein LUZ60_008516 [Juncus effusus]
MNNCCRLIAITTHLKVQTPLSLSLSLSLSQSTMMVAVVVFDFDKTLIECDSDNWVITQFGLSSLFDQLYPSLDWNSLMDRMMSELHARGKSIQDIADCLKKIPLDPHAISAIKSAYSLGCDLRVVSDANVFFIETVLKHHGIYDCFTEINSNPTFLDEEGRLRISPFHGLNSPPHSCPLCPPNMCKGKIIERIRSSVHKEGIKNHFIYFGDGSGDYCPCLKLNEGDYIMPRDKYPLSNLILTNIHLIKAEVHKWSNGEELENILINLIHKLVNKDQSDNISQNCKCENSVSAEGKNRSVAIKVPQ